MNGRHGGQHGVAPDGWLNPSATPPRRGITSFGKAHQRPPVGFGRFSSDPFGEKEAAALTNIHTDVPDPLKRPNPLEGPRGPAGPTQQRPLQGVGPRGDERARDEWRT